MKYAINKSIRNLTKQDFLKLCTLNDIEHKKEILDYLKSFEPEYCSVTYIKDIFMETEITEIDELGYFDGEYVWYSSWTYHFEKYNLKLNDDFIEHVLKNINVVEE